MSKSFTSAKTLLAAASVEYGRNRVRRVAQLASCIAVLAKAGSATTAAPHFSATEPGRCDSSCSYEFAVPRFGIAEFNIQNSESGVSNVLEGHSVVASLTSAPKNGFTVSGGQVSSSAKQNRIIVSHDRRIMPEHFVDFVANQSSPGLIVVSRKLGISKSADCLHLIWEASEAEEYVNTIFQISP